jgi:hypothetical protein
LYNDNIQQRPVHTYCYLLSVMIKIRRDWYAGYDCCTVIVYAALHARSRPDVWTRNADDSYHDNTISQGWYATEWFIKYALQSAATACGYTTTRHALHGSTLLTTKCFLAMTPSSNNMLTRHSADYNMRPVVCVVSSKHRHRDGGGLCRIGWWVYTRLLLNPLLVCGQFQYWKDVVSFSSVGCQCHTYTEYSVSPNHDDDGARQFFLCLVIISKRRSVLTIKNKPSPSSSRWGTFGKKTYRRAILYIVLSSTLARGVSLDDAHNMSSVYVWCDLLVVIRCL